MLALKDNGGSVTPAMQRFADNIKTAEYKPIKSSQWESYSVTDATFLTTAGRDILNGIRWKGLSLGAFACPDEIYLSTLLVCVRNAASLSVDLGSLSC